LKRDEHFEILNRPELFILIYRFIPPKVRVQIRAWEAAKKSTGSAGKTGRLEGRIRKINHLINALNIKLHKALRQDDSTFVSRTMLESTLYRPQNIVVLRAVLINPLTEPPVLREIAETQVRLGIEIWKSFEAAYERLLV
jgi:glutamate decarboxylase